ncbi:hypothetical protein V5N11_014242 [Cardamine amara subsp. amara]|uniref:Uncharacterized protein n=1 Tax=Cardamine amara subsp. amara TaxID=228776 RepID=A0ABD0Z8Z7_CARAN
MATPSWANEERNNHHNNVYSHSSMNETFFMKHNAGTALTWKPQEQATLVDGLAKYSLEPNVRRYLLIASKLEYKTARDVAIRCKWLYNKENSKRRKEDHNGLEVNSTPASHLIGTSPLITDEEHGIAYVLFKKNEQLFNQISANFTSSLNLRENLNLFTKTLENFSTLLTNLNENVCEPMSRMPSLPVKLNLELWNEVIPPLPYLVYNE